jgi:imidazoleglycerol phosphate dehydratase HisB
LIAIGIVIAALLGHKKTLVRFDLVDFVLDQALLNLVGHINGIALPLVITELEQASVEELSLLNT